MQLEGQIIEEHQRDNHYTKTTYGLSVGASLKYCNAGAHYSKEHHRSQTLANGKEQTLYATKTELAVDTAPIEVLADPVQKGKDIYTDAQALYSMVEGTVEAVSKATKLGVAGTMNTLVNNIEDVPELYTKAKDEKAIPKINNAQEAIPAELAAVINQEAHKLQARAGAEDPANVLLYQGQDKQFEDSDLQRYAAGYDTAQNKIYLNTQKTDLSQGSDIMASLYHEAQRKENHINPALRHLNDEQQEQLAHFRGDRAQKVWNRLSGASRKANPTATQAWNQRNSSALATSNAFVAQSREVDVKPRE